MRSGLVWATKRKLAQVWGILLGPRLRRKWKRWRWEGRWRHPASRRQWLGRGVPREVMVAVENGWFPRGAPALEIGCGEGEIAAWLSGQGCPSVGVDIASAALEVARARFPESPGRLEFHVVDVCREAPPDRQYRILVDRACYHQIAPEDRRAYWRTIVGVSAPDARLLLLARIPPRWPLGDPAAIREVRQMVEDGLEGAFTIERTSPTQLISPALAVWMIRRSDGPPPR